MRITTLGTSHGDPTATSFQSSILLETGGGFYLFDAGEPVSALLIRRGLHPAMLSAIFLTHMHLDHSGGLPVAIMQAWKYRRNHPEVRLDVFLPEEGAVPALTAWLNANKRPALENGTRLLIVHSGPVCDDGRIRVTAIPTRHLGNTPGASFSYLVEAESKKIFFSGDLAPDYSDFAAESADGCDLVFSELTHYPLEKALPVLSRLRIGQLVFTHLHNPYQTEEGRARVLRATENFSYPVAIAGDGFSIEL